jgi:hypothetical protein
MVFLGIWWKRVSRVEDSVENPLGLRADIVSDFCMGFDTGTTSIHITKQDKKLLERNDLGNKQVGEAYHTAVEEMDRHRQLRQEKTKELRKRVTELKKECEKWGIDIYDLI